MYEKMSVICQQTNRLHFIGQISFLLNNNYIRVVIVVCEIHVCTYTCYICMYIYVMYKVVLHTYILCFFFCIVSICYKHVLNMLVEETKKIFKNGSLPKK